MRWAVAADLGLLDIEAGNLRGARHELSRSLIALIDLDPDAAARGLAVAAAVANDDDRFALAGVLAGAAETFGHADARSDIHRERIGQFLVAITPDTRPADRHTLADLDTDP